MSLKRKRILAAEKKMFNSKWELDYFMMETAAHSMMGPIGSHALKTVKRDNAKQYFCRLISHNYAKLTSKSRKICAKNLKKRLRQQSSCISTFVIFNDNRCEASYRVAYHFGVVGKPYSDWKLV